jgi:hypothetical protein
MTNDVDAARRGNNGGCGADVDRFERIGAGTAIVYKRLGRFDRLFEYVLF